MKIEKLMMGLMMSTLVCVPVDSTLIFWSHMRCIRCFPRSNFALVGCCKMPRSKAMDLPFVAKKHRRKGPLAVFPNGKFPCSLPEEIVHLQNVYIRPNPIGVYIKPNRI